VKRARQRNKKADLKKQKSEDKIQNAYIEFIPKHNQGTEGKKTKKKKNIFLRILAAIGITIAVLFAALVILVFCLFGTSIFERGTPLAPVENGKVNVLMLGVDESGLRSDTIMVASFDTKAKKVNMLSIPRDTKIYISNRKMTRKINEIHAMSSKSVTGEIYGAEAMAEAVTKVTGIPINYYVEFSFSGVDNLFNILGPVDFNVPDIEGKGRGMNYDDSSQNLHIHLKPGQQKLTGNQIQQFLRYRKSNYGVGTGSDTDRIVRQQELVKAVIDQKVNLGLIVKTPDILKQISKDIHTNIKGGDILRYSLSIARMKGDGITTYSLPGENKMVGGGSYFVLDSDETAKLVKEVFGYDVSPTDSIELSNTHSQKILKAGNMNKKNESTKATPAPTKSPSATKAPAKTPEATKAPVSTPVATKKPTATKTPLEQIEEDEDDGVISLD